MGKYLKLFKTHQEYEAYSGEEMMLPNVCLCVEENEVHYNPIKTFTILTLEMTGGDSLIFNAGTKSDGTSLQGFILKTGEKVQIIQAPITVHLQNADTASGMIIIHYNTDFQYTTSSGDSYYYSKRLPRADETITFTPLEDLVFYADID